MMPNCQYDGCEKSAEFLGPREEPALCAEHTQQLVKSLDDGGYLEENDKKKVVAFAVWMMGAGYITEEILHKLKAEMESEKNER